MEWIQILEGPRQGQLVRYGEQQIGERWAPASGGVKTWQSQPGTWDRVKEVGASYLSDAVQPVIDLFDDTYTEADAWTLAGLPFMGASARSIMSPRGGYNPRVTGAFKGGDKEAPFVHVDDDLVDLDNLDFDKDFEPTAADLGPKPKPALDPDLEYLNELIDFSESLTPEKPGVIPPAPKPAPPKYRVPPREDVGKGMAEEIRDLLARDRPLEVSDEMMAQASQPLLTQIYDLPMDEASRRQRAAAQGYKLDKDAWMYHGLGKSLKTEGDPAAGLQAFRFGSDYPPNQPLASEPLLSDYFNPSRLTYIARNPHFASAWTEGRNSGQPEVVPVAYRFPNKGVFDSALNIDDAMLNRYPNINAELTRARDVGNWGSIENADVLRAVHGEGYDAALVSELPIGRNNPENRRMTEALTRDPHTSPQGMPYSWNLAMFDPRNLRSPFARFDPRLSHLRHLGAAMAGASIVNMDIDELNNEIEEYMEISR